MKKIILTIFALAVVVSCDDRLEELNQPTKEATEVTADALFANGVRNMFDMMVNTDVNVNIFRLLAQYWAQTTYPDETRYNFVAREIPDNFWEVAYRDVLKDLDEAEREVNETFDPEVDDEANKNNKLAMIQISKVYTFAILVDVFGAVPYEEALNDEILVPAYTSGDQVYQGIIAQLDEAINTLDPAAGGFEPVQDLIYGGDAAGWLKFANSLKLRLAMMLADVNPQQAATMATEAIAGGVFEGNEDNAAIQYQPTPPSTNPVWEDLVQSGRADYVVSNTLVDRMQELADPRLPIYAGGMDFLSTTDSVFADGGTRVLYYPMQDSVVFATPPFTLPAADPAAPVQLFKGGEYGTSNTYSANSPPGALFHDPALEGLILDYAEVQFFLAEAAERGIPTPTTAEGHYTAGIRASMEYWGIGEELIEAYLAQPTVAYATAAGDFKQKIGIQSWLALYNRGFEGWTVWRRLDFEGFNVPTGLSEEDIPNRVIFPIEEATLNPSNYRAAIDMIGGSNDVQTRIFWDTQ